MKAAGAAEEWRKESDVHAHEQEQHPGCGGGASRLGVLLRARKVHGVFVGARGISFSNSRASSEKSAVAAELRGCITMSHPGEISCRCSLRISRSRRRMRLRRTALPSAFLMLQPNRLRSRPLGRTKRVNSRLERRLPSRYTTSYSARRATRHSRGSPPGATSDSREAMTSLFAASGKNFATTLRLHAFAEAVFFVTAAHMGLKSTFRQRILSSIFAGCAASAAELAHRMPSRTQANLVVYSTVAARSRNGAW
jgi:hypothetical protein